MWHQIKWFLEDWLGQIKDFFGEDPSDGFKTSGLSLIISIPLNILFISGMYNLLTIGENKNTIDLLVLIFASPLILIELLILILGIIERKVLSLFFFGNVFLISSVLYFGLFKIVLLSKSKSLRDTLERFHEAPWVIDHDSPSIFTWNIPQRKKDIPIQTMDLWKMVSNTKEFVYKNFQESQSLLRFFKERINKPGENQLDSDFLFFSLLVPNKTKISVEGLKSILLSYPGVKNNNYYLKISKEIISNKTLDIAFAGYSESQIKKILTRRYSPEDFFDVVVLLQKDPQKLPVLDNLKEIKSLLRAKIDNCLCHPCLINVHNQNFKNFKFSLITERQDFSLWAKKLDNCLEKNYIDKEDVDVVGILKGTEFYGAISFRNGQFEQIKGYNNKDLPQEEIVEIFDFIKNKISS